MMTSKPSSRGRHIIGVGSPPSPTPAALITERAFRQMVLDLARTLGWRAYFSWSSLHSPAGYPDLVLCRESRLIMAELKSEKGKLTEAQEEWLEALRETGKVEVFTWKPSDWDDIVETLY